MENYKNQENQSDWGPRPFGKEDLDLRHEVKKPGLQILPVGKENVEWVVKGGSLDINCDLVNNDRNQNCGSFGYFLFVIYMFIYMC